MEQCAISLLASKRNVANAGFAEQTGPVPAFRVQGPIGEHDSCCVKKVCLDLQSDQAITVTASILLQPLHKHKIKVEADSTVLTRRLANQCQVCDVGLLALEPRCEEAIHLFVTIT